MGELNRLAWLARFDLMRRWRHAAQSEQDKRWAWRSSHDRPDPAGSAGKRGVDGFPRNLMLLGRRIYQVHGFEQWRHFFYELAKPFVKQQQDFFGSIQF